MKEARINREITFDSNLKYAMCKEKEFVFVQTKIDLFNPLIF